MDPTVHGFRFKPTDKELMRYLEAFVLGKPLNNTFEFIALEDLYGGKEPWQIFGTGLGESIRYYFTELRRKCQRGSRFLRGVGDGGTWKGQDAGQPICDETKKVVGFKRSLRYQGKRSRRETCVDESGVWLMKEYSLSDDYLRGKEVVHKDFVLCRIKKVSRKTSRSPSTQNIIEDDTLKVYEWPENPTLDEDVSNGVDDQGVNTGEMIEGDGTTGDMNDDVSRLLMTELPVDFTLDDFSFVQ